MSLKNICIEISDDDESEGEQQEVFDYSLMKKAFELFHLKKFSFDYGEHFDCAYNQNEMTKFVDVYSEWKKEQNETRKESQQLLMSYVHQIFKEQVDLAMLGYFLLEDELVTHAVKRMTYIYKTRCPRMLDFQFNFVCISSERNVRIKTFLCRQYCIEVDPFNFYLLPRISDEKRRLLFVAAEKVFWQEHNETPSEDEITIVQESPPPEIAPISVTYIGSQWYWPSETENRQNSNRKRRPRRLNARKQQHTVNKKSLKVITNTEQTQSVNVAKNCTTDLVKQTIPQKPVSRQSKRKVFYDTDDTAESDAKNKKIESNKKLRKNVADNKKTVKETKKTKKMCKNAKGNKKVGGANKSKSKYWMHRKAAEKKNELQNVRKENNKIDAVHFDAAERKKNKKMRRKEYQMRKAAYQKAGLTNKQVSQNKSIMETKMEAKVDAGETTLKRRNSL